MCVYYSTSARRIPPPSFALAENFDSPANLKIVEKSCRAKSELRGSMEWIYGFSRSSVWLSKMWNFPFSMFSEIVLPMTVLPPAIFATSI